LLAAVISSTHSTCRVVFILSKRADQLRRKQSILQQFSGLCADPVQKRHPLENLGHVHCQRLRQCPTVQVVERVEAVALELDRNPVGEMNAGLTEIESWQQVVVEGGFVAWSRRTATVISGSRLVSNRTFQWLGPDSCAWQRDRTIQAANSRFTVSISVAKSRVTLPPSAARSRGSNACDWFAKALSQLIDGK